jgi:hypothetical protein
LRVRTDRGALLDASPTGAGLVLDLDATGSGAVTLDASEVRTGGEARVGFTSPSAGAAGEVRVQLTGDDRLPTVWAQTPSGPTEGLVDTVVLTFDEPLLASTVQPGSFFLEGPFAGGVGSASLVAHDRVELGLTTAVDASAGAWTITATAALRDLSGNRLDGAFTGGPGPWVGPFGAVLAPVDAVSCEVDPARFRPDGDPGVGEEADQALLSIQSASAPAWWVVSVRDAGGVLVARERRVPVGPLDVWAWDGRDVDERVVDDGAWTLSVEPVDALGNRGAACSVVVVVDNEEVP